MKNRTQVIAFVLLLTLSFLPMSVLAQDQDQQASPSEMVVIPKDRLTQDQLTQLKTEQTMQQLEAYGKWANMGRAIGIGVRETLSAVTDETARFAQTDVGKLTMFLVAWKIMADDVPVMANNLIGYLVGIPLFLICTLCIFWSYRKHGMPRRVLVKKTRGGLFKVEKEWKEVEPADDLSDVWISHGIAFVVATLISLWIIFS